VNAWASDPSGGLLSMTKAWFGLIGHAICVFIAIAIFCHFAVHVHEFLHAFRMMELGFEFVDFASEDVGSLIQPFCLMAECPHVSGTLA
jgi:hypothetical protein